MKGPLVSFLLLVGLLVFQVEPYQRRSDDSQHHEKGKHAEELSFQSPPSPTNIPPGPPKYGLCPATPSWLSHPVTAYCLEHRCCPGDEKCCRVGNIRKCILPEGVHHGYCPRQEDGAIYKKPCAGDHQCSWHEKCCKTDHHKKCTPAVPGGVSAGHMPPPPLEGLRGLAHSAAAPGLCPKRNLPRVFTPCTNQCKDDRSCPLGKKCCFAECGLKCVTPERHRPGEPRKQDRDQAEEQKAGKEGGDAQASEEESVWARCHTGRDCPHRKRCCRGVCRRECRPQDICHLPKEKGPCDARDPRWFYNHRSRRCERFIYGGCCGNANNFKLLEECERRCVNPGLRKPGTCPTPVQTNNTMCGQFCSTDSSCPGSERCCATPCGRQCERPEEDFSGYCPLLILPRGNDTICFKNCTGDWDCNSGVHIPWKKCCHSGDRKLCLEAAEEHPGVCPRKTVVQTFTTCNSSCSDDRDCPLTEKCCFSGCSRGCLPSVCSDRCQLPSDQGSCSQHLERYYYSPAEKKCVPFVYHGCGGNRNNFETRSQCEKACGRLSRGTAEVCKLPADPGPCRGYSENYYYNRDTKKCEKFVHGLCGGNENRFPTKLECRMVCEGLGAPHESQQFVQQFVQSDSSPLKHVPLWDVTAWKWEQMPASCCCRCHSPSSFPWRPTVSLGPEIACTLAEETSLAI
ncbi:papilin-like [Candoia aspera]|uniref:papilin-like n=1 Tax=Candoia aspera TaxID=51853 RepID=UPI002FD83904